ASGTTYVASSPSAYSTRTTATPSTSDSEIQSSATHSVTWRDLAPYHRWRERNSAGRHASSSDEAPGRNGAVQSSDAGSTSAGSDSAAARSANGSGSPCSSNHRKPYGPNVNGYGVRAMR